jgi:nucleoside 2-deoxyribosyltransferase
MPRVYFARAMDGLADTDIRGSAAAVRAELAAAGLEMVDTYECVSRAALDPRTASAVIVESDLALLRTADAVLMDLSIPARAYVGCLCELVYAHQWGIPVYAYVGVTDHATRHWLRYHAKVVGRERGPVIAALVGDLTCSDRVRSDLAYGQELQP